MGVGNNGSQVSASVSVMPPPLASDVRGVGNSRHDAGTSSIDDSSRGNTPLASSIACSSDGPLRLSMRVAASRLVRSAFDRGVGSSTSGTLPCESGGPHLFARGVASSRFFRSRWAAAVPPGSCDAGVGNNEQPLAAMRRARVGSSYSRPFRIEPRFGKVGEDSVEAQGKVPCDVLKDAEVGS